MQLEQSTELTADKNTERSWIKIVARNFSATMIASIVDSVLRFIAYGYVARRLGPEFFGINSFMYTTTFFFGSLSDFGLRILGAREIASHPDDVERQASTTLSIKLVFIAIAFVGMQIFVLFARDTAQVKWLAVIYGLSLFGFNTADWILIGLEQMHYIGIARIINGVGVFVLMLALIRGPDDLLLVGGIESFTTLLAGGFLLYVASRKVKLRLSVQLAEWKTLFREAFPLGVSLVMIRLGTSLPVFALGMLSSDYEVGIYRAVSLLPSFLEQATRLLAEALLPTLSRIYVQSQQRFVRIMIWTQKYLAVGGILLTVFGILLGSALLPRVLGDEFRNGLGTYQILMIVSGLVFSNQCLRRLLPACHAQQQYALVMTSRTVTLLAFSLIVAGWGSEAEAWAVFLAEACASILSVYFFQRQFPSSQLPVTLVKTAIAGGVFATTVVVLKGNLVSAIPLGMLAYGMTLTVLRVVSYQDVDPIKFN